MLSLRSIISHDTLTLTPSNKVQTIITSIFKLSQEMLLDVKQTDTYYVFCIILSNNK